MIATLAAAGELCTAAVPSLNDSRQAEILAAVIVMMALSTIAVVLRLISRKISAARIGIDDGLMVLALVSLPIQASLKTR